MHRGHLSALEQLLGLLARQRRGVADAWNGVSVGMGARCS